MAVEVEIFVERGSTGIQGEKGETGEKGEQGDQGPTGPSGGSLHSTITLDDGTNPHNTTFTDVGLGNVDNTSDLDKPISTATQTALDLKVDIIDLIELSNVIIVNSASDFPTAVGNVITLAANTTYQISGEVDISTDRFDVSASGVTIVGNNPNVDKILTATTGALFTGASIRCHNIGATVSSGEIFDMDGLGVIALNGFFVFGCISLGSINATGLLSWSNSNITNMSTSGLTLTGVCRSIIIRTCSFSNFDGIALDLNTSTASLIRIDGNRWSGVVGSVSLNVAASSGNIIALGEGWVVNNLFNGDGTPTSGTSAGDESWTYHDNSEIANSFRGGSGHVLGNGTATSIATISTPVQVDFGGAFISDLESSFTVDTDGCFTYTGTTLQNISASATIYGDSASGTNVSYRFYFAKNGVVNVGSVSQEQYDSSDPHSTPVAYIDQVVTGDEICLWVENITNTVNITIETASIRVVGV